MLLFEIDDDMKNQVPTINDTIPMGQVRRTSCIGSRFDWMAMKLFRKKPMPYCSMITESVMELSNEDIYDGFCGSRDVISSTRKFLQKFEKDNMKTKACIRICMSNGLVTGSSLALWFESLGAIPARIVSVIMILASCRNTVCRNYHCCHWEWN